MKETDEFIGWCCTGASEELIEYLFEETNVEIFNAMALTYNQPSNRVIQKCGFKYMDNIQIGERWDLNV